MTKVDNVSDRINELPCNQHGEEIVSTKTWVSIFKWYIPISITVLSILLGVIICLK